MTNVLYIAVSIVVLLLIGTIVMLEKDNLRIGQTCTEGFYQAVETRDSAKVESFLSQESCALDAASPLGYSPLTLAASKNDFTMLEILLRDVKSDQLLRRDGFGRNAIDYAIRAFDSETLQLYLDFFPGMLTLKDNGISLYEKILKKSSKADFDGPINSILYMLEENDPKQQFRERGREILLEKAGAQDVVIRDQWIQYFLYKAWAKGSVDEIKSMIEKGADPFVPYEGKSVFDRAIRQKKPLVFTTLVNLTPGDLERTDRNGKSLLDKTIEGNFFQGVKTLVEAQTQTRSLEEVSDQGLLLAVESSIASRNFEIVNYLMSLNPSEPALQQVRERLWGLCDGNKWIPKALLMAFYGKDYWKGSVDITRNFKSLLTGLAAPSLVICDDAGCDPGQLKKVSEDNTSKLRMVYEIEGKSYPFEFRSLDPSQSGGFEYQSGQSVRVGKLTGMALLDVPNTTVSTIIRKEGKDHLKLVTINITGKGASSICIPLTKTNLPRVMDKVHKMKFWQLLMEYYAYKEG